MKNRETAQATNPDVEQIEKWFINPQDGKMYEQAVPGNLQKKGFTMKEIEKALQQPQEDKPEEKK